MGDMDTSVADAARKAKKRAADRHRRQRAAWTAVRDWPGRRVPVFGWYIAIFAVASGLMYGVLAGRGTGLGGLADALVGAAIAVIWGAAVFATIPPPFASLVVVISLFASMLAFGPHWPAAVYAGTVASVAGWMLGIHLRYVIVGRRRAAAENPTIENRSRRLSKRLLAKQRTNTLIAAIAAAVLLALGAFQYFHESRGSVGIWVLAIIQALAWTIPMAWWRSRAPRPQAEGLAPYNAALWGILLNAYASAAIGTILVSLTAAVSGLVLGSILFASLRLRAGRR